MAEWSYMSASAIGSSHLAAGTRMQDASFSWVTQVPRHVGPRAFIGIISDGAGSAKMGGQGASIVCRTIGAAARERLKISADPLRPAEVESWVDEARYRIWMAAARLGLKPRDFSATLVAVFAFPDRLITAQIGDGAAVGSLADADKWIALTWPAHGEYASTTYFVTQSPPALRVAQHIGEYSHIALFSDGIERLALDFSEKEPFQPFFSSVSRPLDGSGPGRNLQLSRGLKTFLQSEKITSRTDDDKTLIVARRNYL